MKIQSTSRINLSRSLGIQRAFVERIRRWKDGICLSAVYRGGRVYACLDKNLKLSRFTDEKDFNPERDWDFRALAVRTDGNLSVMGSAGGDRLEFYDIPEKGPIEKTGSVDKIPYGAGLFYDDDTAVIHTPLSSSITALLDNNQNIIGALGDYPPGRNNLESRMAQIHPDGDGGCWAVFENSPASLVRISSAGKTLLNTPLTDEAQSIDNISAVLDSSVCPLSGRILLLLESAGGPPLLKAFDGQGRLTGSMNTTAHVRRICILADGDICLVSTSFGIGHMISSFSLYGCVVTALDRGTLQW